MYPKLALISSTLLFLLMPAAQGQPAESIFPYTLQVASFPDAALAEEYAEHLAVAGEAVGFGTYELAGRGHWTRVYVGSFKTPGEARHYGEALIGRKLIAEYLVKTAGELQSLGRPHTVNRVAQAGESPAPLAAPRHAPATPLANSAKPRPALIGAPQHAVNVLASGAPGRQPAMSEQLAGLFIPLHDTLVTLPVAHDRQLPLAPAIDMQAIPRPDPVYLAFNLISESRNGRGGLWVSGDCEEGLARLRYILGEHPQLLNLGDNGLVRINHRVLAEVAGASQVSAEEAPLRIAEYINAHEGLLLLVQLTEGAHRYMLHIGRRGPTLGGMIDIIGGVNLDNNYDSRINPHRKHSEKLDIERPPQGFESLVALNPNTLWFNLRTHSLVAPGEITFHELAEAHAKLELGLDYLDQGTQSGAHALALEREQRLKSQRPNAEIVLTAGSNLVLRTEQEIRLFYAEGPRGLSQR